MTIFFDQKCCFPILGTNNKSSSVYCFSVLHGYGGLLDKLLRDLIANHRNSYTISYTFNEKPEANPSPLWTPLYSVL